MVILPAWHVWKVVRWQVVDQNIFVAHFRQMGTPLETFQQQYATEVLKVDADEGLLKRLERGIRGLKGVEESTG